MTRWARVYAGRYVNGSGLLIVREQWSHAPDRPWALYAKASDRRPVGHFHTLKLAKQAGDQR